MKKRAFFVLVAGLVFFGCDTGNDTNDFIASTNETISNDVTTLGLTGTSVSSDKPNVATAEITTSAKIKITSVSEGSAVITVSDASSHNATINISVAKTGSITIGTIAKYAAGNGTTGGNDDIPEGFPADWKTLDYDAWEAWWTTTEIDYGDDFEDYINSIIDFLYEYKDEMSEEANVFWGFIVKLPFEVNAGKTELTANPFKRGGGGEVYTLQNDENKGEFPIGKWVANGGAFILFTADTITIQWGDGDNLYDAAPYEIRIDENVVVIY
jgi:hypothetical protein